MEDAFAERFWEDVERVTDGDVRELYARVGLWEDRQPGSFSLRTLSVLRDLDRNAKKSFEDLCRGFVLGDRDKYGYVVSFTEIPNLYSSSGLSWDDLLLLEDAGLIVLNDGTSHSFDPPEPKEELDWGLFVLRPGGDAVWPRNGVSIPVYPLSRAGVELARLVDEHSACEEYVWAISCLIQKRDPYVLSTYGESDNFELEWRLAGEDSGFQSVDGSLALQHSPAWADYLGIGNREGS